MLRSGKRKTQAEILLIDTAWPQVFISSTHFFVPKQVQNAPHLYAFLFMLFFFEYQVIDIKK